MSENAAMSYNPADDDQSGSGGIQSALAKAERQLSHQDGVRGVGMTKTPAGQDAIVVYVEHQQTISQLPSDVDGYSVIGEVTGDVRAF